MIRPATSKDVPTMIALFQRQHAEMGCDWSIDVDRLENTFRRAISDPSSWLCLTDSDCLLLAMCFDCPLGSGRLGIELALCASPRRFDEVVNAYEEWAHTKGCRKASLSCIHRFPAFARLYGRRGYRPAEMTFSKVL